MQVDARDLFNPKPLVMAIEALSRLGEGETLAISVNDGKAVESMVRLAEEQALKFVLEDEGDYSVVTLEPTRPVRIARPVEDAVRFMDIPGKDSPTIIFTSECVGIHDRELGQVLMREIIIGLATQEVSPQALVFLNSAVKMTCQDEVTIRYLEAFGPATKILSDVVSLDRFGLEDSLKVGEKIEPYNLAQLLVSRTNVITL